MKQSSVPNKSAYPDGNDTFSDTTERSDKSMKELQQMLEKKEGELKEQFELTKEFKVCLS